MKIVRIRKVLDVHWVASSFRSAKTVWQSYTALHQHFAKRIDNDDARELSKFSEFTKKFENPCFMNYLNNINGV